MGFAPTTWFPRSMTSGQGFGIRGGRLAKCTDPCTACTTAGAHFPANSGDSASRRARSLVCPAMRTAPPRLLGAALALAVAALLGGCGKSGRPQSSGGPTGSVAAVAPPGALAVSTRNTTRLGGAGAVEDAAAVARAVYPGLTPATRPAAVVLVDERDWSAALAASALAGAPLGAPLLYSGGDTLPPVSRETLEALRPVGAPALGGAQVIRIGSSAAVPGGYVTRSLAAAEPAVAAAGVERP